MIPKRIVIHCSASKNGVRWDIEAIRKMHIEQNGWRDVGYHLVIQPDGEAQRGRGLNEVGAHVEGHNEGSIGICLVGLDKFTSKQFQVLRYHLEAIKQVYSIPDWEVYGHYQFDSAQKQKKSCPNIPINNLLAWFIGHQELAIEAFLLKS